SAASPPLHRLRRSPFPMPTAQGGFQEAQPTPPRTKKSSLSRSDGEGDRSRSEWWRGERSTPKSIPSTAAKVALCRNGNHGRNFCLRNSTDSTWRDKLDNNLPDGVRSDMTSSSNNDITAEYQLYSLNLGHLFTTFARL